MPRNPADDKSKSKKKERNGVLYALFWEISLRLVEIFKRYKVSANTVTLLGLAFYILGGLFFLFGLHFTNILAALLLVLGVLMDCTDGKLARETHKTSYMGIWLDYNIDYIRYLFIYPPIALGIFRNTGGIDGFIYGFIIITAILSYVIIAQRYDEFPFAESNKEKIAATGLHKLAKEFYAYEIVEVVSLLIFALINRIDAFLVFWTFCAVALYLGTAVVLGKSILEQDRKNER